MDQRADASDMSRGGKIDRQNYALYGTKALWGDGDILLESGRDAAHLMIPEDLKSPDKSRPPSPEEICPQANQSTEEYLDRNVSDAGTDPSSRIPVQGSAHEARPSASKDADDIPEPLDSRSKSEEREDRLALYFSRSNDFIAGLSTSTRDRDREYMMNDARVVDEAHSGIGAGQDGETIGHRSRQMAASGSEQRTQTGEKHCRGETLGRRDEPTE